MPLPSSQYSLSLTDFSGEKSVVQWSAAEITGGAFDMGAWKIAADDLADAIMDLTDCSRGKELFSGIAAQGSEALPVIATAQREVAIRIFYQDDTTGKKYHLSIPGPQVEDYPEVGSDEVPLDGTDMAAFITLFESNALSEVGNAVTVYAARLVGRRN
jgi:hypothetical protein